MIKPTVDIKSWGKRVAAARQARELHEQEWSLYALLHRRLIRYRQRADAVQPEDETLELPHGDNVRVGTLFKNLEQAMALLDTKEIGVRAKQLEYREEMDFGHVHAEQLAEVALFRSLSQSGLLRGAGVDDAVTRDGVVLGMGVSYSYWKTRRIGVEEVVPVLSWDDERQTFAPQLDAQGQPVVDTLSREEVVFDGVCDEHVPALEFLFEPAARDARLARWHAREWVESLEVLRKDERFEVPEQIKGGEVRRRSLYGDEWEESMLLDDAVRGMTIFDCESGELLHLLDTPTLDRPIDKRKDACELVLIGAERPDVRFTNATRSPFNVFVPIPAIDDPYGISQIEHIQGLSVEIDVLRSRIANMTTLLKRIFLYDKKSGITQDEIDAALAARDYSFIGIDNPDEAQDLSTLFHEFPVPAVRAEFYRLVSMASADVTAVSGVLEDPWAGGSSATEAEHKFNIGGARMARKTRLKYRWLSELAETHLALLRAYGEEGRPMQIETAEGVEMVPFGRDALAGYFQVEVTAGGGATSISPVQQKMAMEAANLLIPISGPYGRLALARQLLTMMDFPGVSEIIQAARQDLAMASGAPAQGAGAPPQQEDVALGDYGVGQTIREGVNAPYEG